jgi:hypothetical protein
MRRCGQIGFDIAAGDAAAGTQKLSTTDRLFQVQNGLGCVTIDSNRLAALRQSGRACRGEHCDRLPHIQQFAVGQERLVSHNKAE